MANAHDNCFISKQLLSMEYTEAASLIFFIVDLNLQKAREVERKRKAEEERQGLMVAVENVMNLRPPAPCLLEEHLLPASASAPTPQDIGPIFGSGAGASISIHHLPAPRPCAPPIGVAGFSTPAPGLFCWR